MWGYSVISITGNPHQAYVQAKTRAAAETAAVLPAAHLCLGEEAASSPPGSHIAQPPMPGEGCHVHTHVAQQHTPDQLEGCTKEAPASGSCSRGGDGDGDGGMDGGVAQLCSTGAGTGTGTCVSTESSANLPAQQHTPPTPATASATSAASGSHVTAAAAADTPVHDYRGMCYRAAIHSARLEEAAAVGASRSHIT